MVANVTRWVRFDASTLSERNAESRIAAVEADILEATVPGTRLSSIFAAIKASYSRHGFGAEQWELHHQGGPAGYAGRDPRVTAAAEDAVVVNQAFTLEPLRPRCEDRRHGAADLQRDQGADGGSTVADRAG